MLLNEIKALDKKHFMNTFGERLPVCFKSGKGAYLYDTENNEYLDFFAGIAVSALGHGNKKLAGAIAEQAQNVIHTSCLYYIEPQAKLAEKVCSICCGDRVYFANSGAEANECAIKLAKIYHYKKGDGKTDIITLKNSFHGRTLTTVAATGQEKYQKPYAPLNPGFSHVEINDYDAFLNAVTEKTGAIVMELIQGESGVHPADEEYVNKVYAYCKENDILFIADEIQTGIGRTGKMYAYEHYGIEPDIVTMAKALGGGVPIGCACAKEAVCAFEPGDHGGTFGGNHLATAAALAVLEVIEEEKLVENAEKMGAYLSEKLAAVKGVKEVRGKGLMIGVEIEGDAKAFVSALFNEKVLVGAVGAHTVRILPPLIITEKEADLFIQKFEKVANSL